MSKSISIVTPTYNERIGINNYLSSMINILSSLNADYEIIVVDDNSPDGTGDYLLNLKKNLPFLHVIIRQGKSGIGSAYLDGFTQAKGDYIIGIDADLSPSIEVIPKFIERLDEGFQMVIGSRYSPGSEIRNVSFFKSYGSRLFNSFCRTMLQIPLNDITHSNRAFTREAFNRIRPNLSESAHPSFFIECSFWAQKQDLRITEVPITFSERTTGSSSLAVRQGLAKGLKTIYRHRVGSRVERLNE